MFGEIPSISSPFISVGIVKILCITLQSIGRYIHTPDQHLSASVTVYYVWWNFVLLGNNYYGNREKKQHGNSTFCAIYIQAEPCASVCQDLFESVAS